MTVIRPNNISGITSITAQGSTVEFYQTSGTKAELVTDVVGNLTGNVTGNLDGTANNATTADSATTATTATTAVTATTATNALGITTSQITIGNAYIKDGAVGVGTTTAAGRDAGIGTAVGTIIYNADTNSVQVYKPTTGWQAIDNIGDTYPLGMTATGGFMNEYLDPGPGKYYRSHTFNSTGTFEVTALGTPDVPATVDYLVVGGGGAAGVAMHSPLYDAASGGGGAGGFVTGTFTASVESKTVIIGAGGVTQAAGNSGTLPGAGQDGSESWIGPPSSKIGPASGGGGGGKSAAPGYPSTGGNPSTASGGGGSSVANLATPGGTGGPQGNNGGDGAAYGGGGGGGAGAVGGNGTPTTGGAGGAGSPNTYAYGTGNPVLYAGGGGGGDRDPGGSPNPGPGGGGSGGNSSNGGHGVDGTQSTGGGGGGVFGSPQAPVLRSGHGGSGTAVVRYEIGPSQVSTAKATGGNIAFRNGQTIHTFASSGTFAITDGSLTTVKCLVVGAGGGGGGGYQAGGGGAGALHYRTAEPVNPSPGSYTVTVGAAGRGATSYGGQSETNPYLRGFTGADSVFASLTAAGGGGGNSFNPNSEAHPGLPGGSGGGAGSNTYPATGGTGSGDSGHPGGIDVVSPPNGWGNDGGATPNPYGSPYSGGGGGGAYEVGGDGNYNPDYGSGGDGARYTILDNSTAIYYAGGGGGGAYGPNTSTGGQGGGGLGGKYIGPTRNVTAGDANTGGGGGGGGGKGPGTSPATGNSPLVAVGQPGGSGIVIISYPT